MSTTVIAIDEEAPISAAAMNRVTRAAMAADGVMYFASADGATGQRYTLLRRLAWLRRYRCSLRIVERRERLMSTASADIRECIADLAALGVNRGDPRIRRTVYSSTGAVRWP